MKIRMSKIRNKRLKGNISLLVILILLASSVIALLSINQIQRLISYGNMTFNYFRAFYLAKAGTELGLTEVYNRDNWFEDKIINKKNSDGTINFEKIIEDNFLWKDNEYEWAKPYFDMEIVSNFKIIGNDIRYDCNDDNKITLKQKDNSEGKQRPWEWIVISLFKDTTTWFKNILNPGWKIELLKNSEIEKLELGDLSAWELTFWLFGYKDDWNMSDIIVKTWTNLSIILKSEILKSVGWTRRYLSIKNSWDKLASFCIRGNDIPYSHYLIDVRWNYADMEVWLKSVVKKEIPSWSLDVLWWENS